jgi:hypothetical protein
MTRRKNAPAWWPCSKAGGRRDEGFGFQLARRLRLPRFGGVTDDPRSRRIAVVADSLLEGRLDELRDQGWGAIQLPPADIDPETAGAWIELTAEQVAEYCRTGYEVVLLDDGTWGAELSAAIAALGVSPLPAYRKP